MMQDSRIQSLLEWNRLARENTENAMVASMFDAGAKARAPIEAFSTWLMVGTAAIASFFIANSDKVIPLLGKSGFSVSGALLCLSCFLGLASKLFALRASIVADAGEAVRSTFSEHLNKYKEEEALISNQAKVLGIDIQTGVRLERILSEFYKPLPKWVGWLGARQTKKHAGNPQIGYLALVGAVTMQGYFAASQALSFLAFLVMGFVYAAAI